MKGWTGQKPPGKSIRSCLDETSRRGAGTRGEAPRQRLEHGGCDARHQGVVESPAGLPRIVGDDFFLGLNDPQMDGIVYG